MSAVEQLQNELAVLIGDRQGLDAELLLRLQSLQAGGRTFMSASTSADTPLA
jgi:hypothetical protein